MAGIGVRLNKLFEKRSIVTALAGMGYSTAVTITPMVVVMVAILLMEKLLGFYNLPYVTKKCFVHNALYIYICYACGFSFGCGNIKAYVRYYI